MSESVLNNLICLLEKYDLVEFRRDGESIHIKCSGKDKELKADNAIAFVETGYEDFKEIVISAFIADVLEMSKGENS